MDANNPVGDEVAPQPNGTVRIGIQGHMLSLRRPVVGEFRKLNELWGGVAIREREIVNAANAIKAEDRQPTWKIDYEEELASAFLGWAQEALRLLATQPDKVPAESELPAWMTTAEFRTILHDHWTTVPLVALSR